MGLQVHVKCSTVVVTNNTGARATFYPSDSISDKFNNAAGSVKECLSCALS